MFNFTHSDKGWKWVVIVGIALSNIFNQPMLSIFSLLYGDALRAMGHNTQGAAFVLSTMLCVTHFVGPIAGILIKLTTCRYVAITGAIFSTTGILLSGFSTNIWHLLTTYGILLGFGLGLLQNASFVTINSYFKSKKSLAVGFATTGTALGQILLPHIVLYLLVNFGFKGACLVLALLSLNGIIGTLLIQPVKWRRKRVEEVQLNEKMYLFGKNNKDTVVFTNYYNVNSDVTLKDSRSATKSIIISENTNKITNNKPLDKIYEKSHINQKLNGNYGVYKSKRTLVTKLYDILDLSLLSSPRFLIVILGNALIVVSIQNFSMLFPFFLQYEALLNKQQTVYCMSAVALTDIIGRLTLPLLQEKYQIKARMMLILTSVWLIAVRQIMAHQSNVYVLLTMSALYGFGRSMAIVVRNIALSELCTIDQVPSAVGLGMLSVGIIVPPTGYFLGWIRDYTNSYIVCITAQDMLLVLLLILWIPDMVFLFHKEKRKKKKKLMQFYKNKAVKFKTHMKNY